ncbi:hypothetical protein [Nocardioides alkalitolerans]|uniref:hypothetical protein n=1 Tax=Nocardioides alkalitolerans TaxID=281714 RepID=UPI0003FCDAFB|nr:hypothetical protein [Nocardioides alkalitolerans]
MADDARDAATRLATRIEIAKLAHELDLGADELAFLEDRDPQPVRRLRQDVSAALYARHETRFRRLAALSAAVPVTIAVKAAQLAVGPVVSARIAASMPPDEAVRMAGRFSPDFLADLTLSLDPTRVEAIIRELDHDLVTKVGRLLLARGEHLVLGRFVSLVDTAPALAVVDGASPGDLLQVALYAEDRSALSVLVLALPVEVVAATIDDSHATGTQTDALTLLTSLDDPARTRVIAALATLPADRQDGFLRAVVAMAAWPEVLPGVGGLDDEALGVLANGPTTADAAVLDEVVAAARALDRPDLLARLLLALDAPHREQLARARVVRDADLVAWVRDGAGDDAARVDALLADLA